MKNKAVVFSLATASLVGFGMVNAPSADALTIKFDSVAVTDRTTALNDVIGSFQIEESVGGFGFTVTSINFTSLAGTAITSNTNYSGGTAYIQSASQIDFETSDTNGYFSLMLDGGATFNQLLAGTIPSAIIDTSTAPRFNNGSFEEVFLPGGLQRRGISGGFVVAEVPEPLTILGTLVAGGIGVAMKKKKSLDINN